MRCDMAGLVLGQPRQPGVLPLEMQHGDGDRHDRHQNDHTKWPVHRQQDGRHHGDLKDVEQQEHQPERQEPANGGQVVHHPREQLSGLPPPVKRHRQDLQAGVEVLTDIGLDAHRGAGHQPAPDEPQHRLGDPDTHRRGAEQPKAALVLMPHGSVDHGLRHKRNRHGGNEAGDRDHHHRDPSRAVGDQVGQQPPHIRAGPPARRWRRDRRCRAQAMIHGFYHCSDLPMGRKPLTVTPKPTNGRESASETLQNVDFGADVMRPRAPLRTASRRAPRSGRRGPAAVRGCRVR